ncbi:hypothetical protein A3Q56_01583 [Intoshia linei]|uniref:Uncharacterized protein n=1 Tax=Intoshia linei TaxID=1819745 RepID=A0A177B8M5_9BILA|nr:hypothetical protein A3Q56_01583 [Intoshia linei]
MSKSFYNITYDYKGEVADDYIKKKSVKKMNFDDCKINDDFVNFVDANYSIIIEMCSLVNVKPDDIPVIQKKIDGIEKIQKLAICVDDLTLHHEVKKNNMSLSKLENMISILKKTTGMSLSYCEIDNKINININFSQDESQQLTFIYTENGFKGYHVLCLFISDAIKSGGKLKKAIRTSQDNFTPLHEAIFTKNMVLTLDLIETSDVNETTLYDKRTALHLCGLTNNGEIANTLLCHNVNVNQIDFYGSTPFMTAVISGSLKVAKLLKETNQIDINERDNFGCTAIMMAAIKGNYPMILYLLNSKFNSDILFNLQSKTGNTALHYAIEEGSIEIVELLLNCKIDIFLVNSLGYYPSDLASKWPEIDKILNFHINHDDQIKHTKNYWTSHGGGLKYFNKSDELISLKNESLNSIKNSDGLSNTMQSILDVLEKGRKNNTQIPVAEKNLIDKALSKFHLTKILKQVQTPEFEKHFSIVTVIESLMNEIQHESFVIQTIYRDFGNMLILDIHKQVDRSTSLCYKYDVFEKNNVDSNSESIDAKTNQDDKQLSKESKFVSKNLSSLIVHLNQLKVKCFSLSNELKKLDTTIKNCL